MTTQIDSIGIRTEEDVVAVRRRVRQIAALLGFDPNDQTRIATAVSEIARNAYHYAGGGKADFVVDEPGGVLTTRISDSGPGIPDLKKILAGRYKSKTGMGLGIVGASRLMDDFRIEPGPEGRGSVVTLSKRMPARAQRLTPQRVSQIATTLQESNPRDVLDELRQENQTLLRVMEELRARQEELTRLNAELEDTNRGVVALYAELDEKAERLRRADTMKSRFLSHMSHEFRTPLSSILALSRLLLEEHDGRLTAEQRKQVTFLRKSAESLLEMVNDLLDLARVEAGKSVVRPSHFLVNNLFGALRGVLRPLQVNEGVELVFEDASAMPPLLTDETKVSQILRNFISNALKFTERGSVRVSAQLSGDGSKAIFAVADTGIGIAPENLDTIFQEFTQLENPLQRKVKGTGLGLPLSKALAELLGGSVRVESTPGEGSTFFAEIPPVYEGANAEPSAAAPACDILVIDDEEIARYLIRQALGPSLNIIEAASGSTGIELAKKRMPRAILLDLRMPGMTGFEVLRDLKADSATRSIPVVILTSKTSLTAEENATLNANAAAVLSKDVLAQPDGGQRIRTALQCDGAPPQTPGPIPARKESRA